MATSPLPPSARRPVRVRLPGMPATMVRFADGQYSSRQASDHFCHRRTASGTQTARSRRSCGTDVFDSQWTPCFPWLNCSVPAQPLRSACSHFVSSLSMKVSCESYLPQLQHPRKTEEEVHLPWHSCSSANRLECFALENYTFLTANASAHANRVYAGSPSGILRRFSNDCLDRRRALWCRPPTTIVWIGGEHYGAGPPLPR